MGMIREILTERQSRLYDQVQPSSVVRFRSLEEVAIAGRHYGLTRSAKRLFAQKLQVPLEYLARCPEDLQADNLNYWIRSLEETPLFIRFDQDRVRAVFSTRYRPIDHLDIAGRMADIFPAEREMSFSLSEELFIIRALDPERTFKMIDVSEDVIRPGVAIVNSETGWSAFSIEAYFLRLVCTNGLIAKTKVSNRIRHIKEGALLEFSQSISLISAEAFALQDKFRISRDQEAADPVATLTAFNKRFGLTRLEAELAFQSWDGGRSMFSLINAYTSAANSPSLPLEVSYKLQRVGGMILGLVK
jgi:hypothetical protein